MTKHYDDLFRPTAIQTDRLDSALESGEVVVYNLEDQRAHCLDPASASVWRLCDGTRSPEQIAIEADLPAETPSRTDFVLAALGELEEAGLIEPAPAGSPGIDRRELLRRVGPALTAAAVVPMIVSIVAPTPAAASTCIQSGGSCTSNLQCCSGFCNGGTCA